MDFTRESNRVYSKDSSGEIIAEITFPEIEKGIVNINHTFVDEKLRGQGIASELVKIAYEIIKSQNKKAIATCIYAIKWFRKNKEYRDILK